MIIKLAILLAVVLFLAAAYAWAFLPPRHLPGNRARHPRSGCTRSAPNRHQALTIVPARPAATSAT